MREFSSDLWELRKLVTQMLASEDKPTYYVQYWQSRGEGSKNLPHSPRSCSRKSLSTAVSFRGRQRNEAELSAVNGEALFGSLVAPVNGEALFGSLVAGMARLTQNEVSSVVLLPILIPVRLYEYK